MSERREIRLVLGVGAEVVKALFVEGVAAVVAATVEEEAEGVAGGMALLVVRGTEVFFVEGVATGFDEEDFEAFEALTAGLLCAGVDLAGVIATVEALFEPLSDAAADEVFFCLLRTEIVDLL